MLLQLNQTVSHIIFLQLKAKIFEKDKSIHCSAQKLNSLNCTIPSYNCIQSETAEKMYSFTYFSSQGQKKKKYIRIQNCFANTSSTITAVVLRCYTRSTQLFIQQPSEEVAQNVYRDTDVQKHMKTCEVHATYKG